MLHQAARGGGDNLAVLLLSTPGAWGPPPRDAAASMQTAPRGGGGGLSLDPSPPPRGDVLGEGRTARAHPGLPPAVAGQDWAVSREKAQPAPPWPPQHPPTPRGTRAMPRHGCGGLAPRRPPP